MAFRGVLPARTVQGQFMNSQDYKFNTVLPYGLPLPSSSVMDPALLAKTHSAVRTNDPFLQKLHDTKVHSEIQNLFYKTQINDQIDQMAANCIRTDIDTLIANQDRDRSIRCGWLYQPPTNNNIPTPRVSQGYLGMTNGPFKFIQPSPQPEAEWIWNLEEAKEKILTARCSALKSCENVGSDNFRQCGFCTGIGQGVPVNSRGQPLYPKKFRSNCSNGRIIMNVNQCPRDPITSPTQEIGLDGLTADGRAPDICTPINGKLSKDCVLKVITDTGCRERGSLYKTVDTSTNLSDYIDTLRSSSAFRLYNENNSKKLYMNLGTMTKAQLESEIQNLVIAADQNRGRPETALGAATADLCYESGSINNWDQCQEISDTATPPFDLVCLQNNFRRMGGQPKGRKYPTESTKIQIYDRMAKYGDVRNYWRQLQAMTKSTTYSTQRQAMLDFYGIDPVA